MSIRISNGHSPQRYDLEVASGPIRPVLRARYQRRRHEVITGAARIFARNGYDQTSVPELAEALGIASGTLYHYFGSKEQLLIAICDQLMEPLLDDAEALLAADEPAEQRLRALVHLWVSHVVAHRDHMLVFQQERHVIDNGAQWRSVREGRKHFERLLDSALGDARGDPDESPRRIVLLALLGMVNHTAQWYRPKGDLSPEEIADGYVDLVLGVPVRTGTP
jgi:AcrR family transcriptional regulator